VLSLAPIALTGSPQLITIPPESFYPLTIRIANESYFALQVRIAGDSHWLDPWTADVFVSPQPITSLQVNPSILLSPIPPNLSATVLLTLAERGEQIPGQYPATLPGQSGGAAPSKPTAYIRKSIVLGDGAPPTRAVLVPAVAGQNVYVFGGTMTILKASAVGAGASMILSTSAGGGNAPLAEVCASVAGAWPFQFNGCPAGLGLDLEVQSANGDSAGIGTATVHYAQQ
jgi:hypothetical protein